MTIVYLYADLQPYQITVFKELVKVHSAKIVAIYWDRKRLTPYVLPPLDSVDYVPKSHFKNNQDLLVYVQKASPDIIYCSGWMDSSYNYVAKKMTKKGIPVIAGSDTQWRGGKQWFNVLFSKVRHQKWFSHIWISGAYQYEYAKKLGFRNEKIIFNSLSADVNLYIPYGDGNRCKRPHSFVFIGRFHPVKGIDMLVKAFLKFKDQHENDWNLICIGNGELRNLLENKPNIEIFDFMEQVDMCKMSHLFGAFILPGTFEQWGLVIHEAACLGLPLLLSEKCGANASFLINDYNGYSFDPYSEDEIIAAMKKIVDMPDDDYFKMREASLKLATRISPEITAASLMSALK